MRDTILDVRGLETRFNLADGCVYAVNGVSFSLARGETLGIVGESGSGKSVTMLSILRLLPSPPAQIAAGTALFHDRDLLTVSDEQMRVVRGGRIGIVFQDPMTSFNAVLTIGRQISETLEVHEGMSRSDARARAAELLDRVGIPRARERLADYPHQFSGGMRQRAMIAMALACRPEILIADEPTTALDVTIQAQIVELMKQLREELGMGLVWITHDLGIIAGLAQRVIVMYGGHFVEEAPVRDLYADPRHPYTIGLLGSLPRVDREQRRKLLSIDGLPPVLLEKPAACPFAPRCSYVQPRCRQEVPPLEEVGTGHRVACWVKPSAERGGQSPTAAERPSAERKNGGT
jgi:oligopeptide transport system ATP-binding protein